MQIQDSPGDIMLLDEQTLKDLEIFQAESGGTSLFSFCDFTRNHQAAER